MSIGSRGRARRIPARRGIDGPSRAAAPRGTQAAAPFQSSPRAVAQRQVIAQLFGDGTALQRKVTMKDGGAARRTSGSGPELRAEVRETIDGGDLADMESTENQLHTSITNRESDLYARKDKNSPVYLRHLARIDLEKELRSDLRAAIGRIKPKPKAAPTKATPKPSGKGGGSSASSNMYALLESM